MPEIDEPNILHEDDTRLVIEDEIEDGVGHDNAAIANLSAASASYVQAEASGTRTTVNAILAALRTNGIILP